ncbi:MAG: hypothetical protein ABJC74_07510 [Gemmatimonadota bacterium]
MSKFRIAGMDWFDVLIHVGITIAVAAGTNIMFGGNEGRPAGDVAVAATFAVSLFLLGLRRKRAMAHALDAPADQQRVEELEARLSDLEQVQFRVAELEERVDFAERMLGQAREQERIVRG